MSGKRGQEITKSQKARRKMYKQREMGMLDIILSDTSQSHRVNNVRPYLNTVPKGRRLIETEDRTVVVGSCGKTELVSNGEDKVLEKYVDGSTTK